MDQNFEELKFRVISLEKEIAELKVQVSARRSDKEIADIVSRQLIEKMKTQKRF